MKSQTVGRELTYRRGYYALPERVLTGDKAKIALAAAMQPAVPEFTGLLLKTQVLPPDAEHKAVRIAYAVDAHDVSFTDAADQHKLASLEFAVTAWDKDYKLAGQLAEPMDFSSRPDAYQQLLRTGLPFHQELELKPGTYTLRIGVLDLNSHKIGSLTASVTIPESSNAHASK